MEKMAEQVTEMDGIVIGLLEIQDDTSVPRNVRAHIQGIISALKADAELSIKLSKALNQLDEITNDVNLQSYTRTSLYNIMSVLEKLQLN
jgi:uncharacterized protein